MGGVDGFLGMVSVRSGLAGRSLDIGLEFGLGIAFLDAAGDMARPMALGRQLARLYALGGAAELEVEVIDGPAGAPAADQAAVDAADGVAVVVLAAVLTDGIEEAPLGPGHG